jgi:hypothetical protein
MGKVVAVMNGHDLTRVGVYNARIFECDHERVDGQALVRVGREGVEQVRRVDANATGVWGIAGQGEQAQRLAHDDPLYELVDSQYCGALMPTLVAQRTALRMRTIFGLSIVDPVWCALL